MPEDVLTLTLRMHDPDEKQDASLSASWAVVRVPRSDLQLAHADFLAKYVVPALAELKQLKLT
jgi:hypothetical protein